MSHRNAQLSGIIRSTVATHALRIPPNLAKVVSVVDVKLSKDFSYADIFLSAVEGVEAAIKFLFQSKGLIRKELAGILRMHKIPILRFHRDTLSEQGNRIDDILSKLKEGNKSKSH